MTSQPGAQLVKMANQIALNMASWQEADTIARKTAEHIEKFWTPAMRKDLLAYQRSGGEGLSPAAISALICLHQVAEISGEEK